ncbi:MAG: tetratricopeptide repeat protein [Bacteroidota bacterium]
MMSLFPTTVIVALILNAGSTAPGGEPDWAEVHNLTMRGIDRLYNLEMDEALATFDSVKAMAPTDPRGYFFGSMVRFWQFSLTRTAKEYEAFIQNSEEVIARCEEILDANDDDTMARFYLGGIYGYRGLAHHANNSMLRAVADGKRGYSYLREAIERRPDLYDAQLGFGIFTYLSGKVPRTLRWIVSMLGFAGDVDTGLKMLQSAAEKGVYTRSEAAFFLSQFLFTEHRGEEAFAWIDQLITKYPDNTLFLLMKSGWKSREGKLDEALAAAQRAAEINARKKVPFGEEFAFSTLGNLYFARNDFVRSRECFERFLTTVRSREYAANRAYYRLGVAQEITGARSLAVGTFARVRPSENDEWGWSMYYYRRALERVTLPLSQGDILAIMADNELGLKNYDSARTHLERALILTPGDPDLEARALYSLMQLHFDQERFVESVEAGLRLVALKPSRETWLIPHGYYRLGRAYARLGRISEAREAFDRVDDFDDFDFQSSLEERVEEELTKLDSPAG